MMAEEREKNKWTKGNGCIWVVFTSPLDLCHTLIPGEVSMFLCNKNKTKIDKNWRRRLP